MSSQKRKRTALDIKQKTDIIDMYNNGIKPKEIAVLYEVNASTISPIVIIKDRPKI